MTVYVDPARHRRPLLLRPGVYCLVMADSADELQMMAERVGLKRGCVWQDLPMPMYCATPKRRARLLAFGAEALSTDAFRLKLRALIEARMDCVCSKTSCGVYECDHCKKLRPNCCGAYDDVERQHGATCDDCAVSLGRNLDAKT